MGGITADDITCLITAAGEGTRMRPLTLTRRKQLLRLCNITVLDHILEAVREAGIRRVGIVVDPDAQQIRDYVAGHSHTGLSLGFAVQPRAEGIGHAILCAEHLVHTDALVVYLGDALYEEDPRSHGVNGGSRRRGIGEFVDRFVSGFPAGLLRVKPVPVQDARQYGVTELEGDGRISRLHEKPSNPPTNLAVTGLYGFQADFLDAIRRTPYSARGELEITDSIQTYVSDGARVYVEPYGGMWADAGQPHHLLAASAAMLRRIAGASPGSQMYGATIVDDGVAVADGRPPDCRVTPPVLIGGECRISPQSEIGPYVTVGDGAAIDRCDISNAIIDQRATVRDAVLDGSIIGVGAHVEGGGSSTGPAVAVLGDGAAMCLAHTSHASGTG